jgi:transcription antitermination factor NusG
MREFSLGDKVSIKEGFYKNQTGVVVGFSYTIHDLVVVRLDNEKSLMVFGFTDLNILEQNYRLKVGDRVIIDNYPYKPTGVIESADEEWFEYKVRLDSDNSLEEHYHQSLRLLKKYNEI